MRWIMSVAILAVLLLGPELSAHPLSVTGTIIERHDTQLVVKTNEGYLVSFTGQQHGHTTGREKG